MPQSHGNSCRRPGERPERFDPGSRLARGRGAIGRSQSSGRRETGRTGFTLIELLVVLVIMAIAAGMITPYVVNTSDLTVISAAQMISCDLQFAQNSAITSQKPVKVTFDPTAEWYSLTWSSTSTPLIHPMKQSDYVIEFPSLRGFGELDVVSADFGGVKEVTFDVLGSPDNPGSISLQAGPHVYVISVAAATGKVTVARAGP